MNYQNFQGLNFVKIIMFKETAKFEAFKKRLRKKVKIVKTIVEIPKA